LTRTPQGDVVLELKTPYRDGTSHVVMTPLEFLQRRARIIHGFSWREVTGGPPPLTKRDRSRFLHQLDELILSIRREHPLNVP
jgi:hypothetical protein